jgi:hypothetical protein
MGSNTCPSGSSTDRECMNPRSWGSRTSAFPPASVAASAKASTASRLSKERATSTSLALRASPTCFGVKVAKYSFFSSMNTMASDHVHEDHLGHFRLLDVGVQGYVERRGPESTGSRTRGSRLGVRPGGPGV